MTFPNLFSESSNKAQVMAKNTFKRGGPRPVKSKSQSRKEAMNKDRSLAEALPEEQARVRELLGRYEALGLLGMFGAVMLERDLKAADQAVMSGDPVAMLRAYEALKGCQ